MNPALMLDGGQVGPGALGLATYECGVISVRLYLYCCNNRSIPFDNRVLQLFVLDPMLRCSFAETSGFICVASSAGVALFDADLRSVSLPLGGIRQLAIVVCMDAFFSDSLFLCAAWLKQCPRVTRAL